MNPTDEIKEINDILGYGKELKVLIGLKEDGQKDIRIFHFTPVSIEEIPFLMQKLNKFFDNSDFMKWTEQDKDNAAEIVHVSIKRMHPDISKDFVKANFGLGIIAKSIKIVMDVNDFLSEVQEMNKTVMEATKGLNLPTKKN